MTLPIGHNGGPPLDDLEVLAGIYSLTIARTSEVTGWSRSRIYLYFDAERLRTYRQGKQRLIIAQSLAEGMSLVSADTIVDAYGVPRVW